MRVAVQITGHPLQMGGVRYNIGERILLDPRNAQHREVLDADGWVKRFDAEALPIVVAAPVTPPVNKMIDQPAVRKGWTKTGRGKK